MFRLDSPAATKPPSPSRRKRQVPQPSPQDVAAFDQNIRLEGGRLQIMLRNLMNSPYMPTRDQVIQILTTVVTLGLMMSLGPVLGSNASVIQSIVRQIVPLIVTASVHYAADHAMPLTPIDAPITTVQLSPVAIPQSPAIANI